VKELQSLSGWLGFDLRSWCYLFFNLIERNCLMSDLIALLDHIPIWKKLVLLPKKIEELEKRLEAIEKQISGTGDVCPYCRKPTGNLIEIKPDRLMGDLGVNIEYYQCGNCGKHYEKKNDSLAGPH